MAKATWVQMIIIGSLQYLSIQKKKKSTVFVDYEGKRQSHKTGRSEHIIIIWNPFEREFTNTQKKKKKGFVKISKRRVSCYFVSNKLMMNKEQKIIIIKCMVSEGRLQLTIWSDTCQFVGGKEKHWWGFTVRLIIDGSPSLFHRPVNLTSTWISQDPDNPWTHKPPLSFTQFAEATCQTSICRQLYRFWALPLWRLSVWYPILPSSRGTSSRRGFHPLKFVRLLIHMNRTRGHSPLELLSNLWWDQEILFIYLFILWVQVNQFFLVNGF